MMGYFLSKLFLVNSIPVPVTILETMIGMTGGMIGTYVASAAVAVAVAVAVVYFLADTTTGILLYVCMNVRYCCSAFLCCCLCC